MEPYEQVKLGYIYQRVTPVGYWIVCPDCDYIDWLADNFMRSKCGRGRNGFYYCPTCAVKRGLQIFV